MSSISKVRVGTHEPRASIAATILRSGLFRPAHHKLVHNFKIAAESGEATLLAPLLDPAIAVVVETSAAGHQRSRVVRGINEAVKVLLDGMSEKHGFTIDERSVSGQAGLLLNNNENNDDRTLAAITVDFNGPRVSAVWIRLNPVRLRHWN